MRNSLDQSPHSVAFLVQRAALDRVAELNADRSRVVGTDMNRYRNWRTITTRKDKARSREIEMSDLVDNA